MNDEALLAFFREQWVDYEMAVKVINNILAYLVNDLSESDCPHITRTEPGFGIKRRTTPPTFTSATWFV